MPVHFDKSKGRWRFQFNRIIKARRYRASRLLPKAWDRTKAEAYSRAEEGRLYGLATGVEQPRALISDAVTLYFKHRLPHLRNGIKAARDLSYVVPFFDGRPLSELADVAREYVAANPDLARATIRNRLAYLRAAVRYAYKHHGLGDRDHSDRMALPSVSNGRQVYLRAAEVERLAKACDDPDMRAIIRIAFYTGCRWISEILPRQSQDVIRDRSGVWLRVPQPKTGTHKMMPVHRAIKKDLERLPFPARHWRDYYAQFEAARARSGLQHVRMHDLRHSLASALISQGETLYVVGNALGNKTAQSTERYAHLYPESVAKAMLRLGKKLPTKKRRQAGRK